MGFEGVIDAGTQALLLVLVLSAPAVVTALVVGLLVSIGQAATQIQEQTVSAVPRMIAVYAALMLAGAWMLRELVDFTLRLLGQVVVLGG